MNVQIEVPEQRIADILCNALEGGSNYWYEITAFGKPSEMKFRTDPKKVYRHIDYPMNTGGSITITSMEEPEREPVNLTREKLERAVQLMAIRHPRHFNDMMTEQDDCTTGDVLLQLACYDDVIYG